MIQKVNRIIITGDLHGDIMRLFNFNLPDATKDDLVIVLGDFGCIWNKETAVLNFSIIDDLPFSVAFVASSKRS